MQVNLEVTFPNYPCAILSLDKMDVLHSHIMDVEENLKKIRINSSQKVIGNYKNKQSSNLEERIQIATE